MALPTVVSMDDQGVTWSDGNKTPLSQLSPQGIANAKKQIQGQTNSIADMASGPVSLPTPPPSVGPTPAAPGQLDPIKMRAPLVGQAPPAATSAPTPGPQTLTPQTVQLQQGSQTSPMSMSMEKQSSFTSGANVSQKTKTDIANASKAEETALEDKAKVETDVWKQQTPIQSQLHKDLTDIDATSQIQRAAVDKQIKQSVADAQNAVQKFSTMKVDPDRFWTNKSVGQRIGLVIAAGLGTFGSALAHSQNTAMDMINSAIDRDVQAQRDDIMNAKSGVDMKNNLVAQLRQQGLDLEQATLAAKQVKMNLAAREMERIATEHGGDKIRANADAMKAEAAKRNALTQKDIDVATSGRFTSTTQSSLRPDANAAKQAGTYVQGYGNAPDEQTAQKARGVIESRDNMISSLNALVQHRKENGVAINPAGDNKKNGELLAENARMQLKEALKLGAISAGDRESIEKLISDPGGFRDPTAQYEKLRARVAAASSISLRALMNQGGGVQFTPSK